MMAFALESRGRGAPPSRPTACEAHRSPRSCRWPAFPGSRCSACRKGSARSNSPSYPAGCRRSRSGPRLDAQGPAFLDTAAAAKALDLVITVDTSLGHLAGALGVPTWLALAYVPDWRWGTEGERIVWYPTMRLFRQTRRGDWSTVFEPMAEALARLAAQTGAAGPAAAKVAGAAKTLLVETAPGELIDKLTILEIKSERITDEGKLANIRRELESLDRVRHEELPASPELSRLTADLKKINEQLWNIEDAIRDCERRGDFGQQFIELARAVYHTNDRRAAVKRKINELLGSAIVEEKSYTIY
jgi:hypothetical protein